MGPIFLWVLGLLLAVIFLWEVVFKVVSRIANALGHSVPCPPSFSWYFESDFRKRYMRPVLDRLGIHPGDRVLELGPGPGAFSVDAARRASPQGRLIIIDIQPEMIAKVEARLRDAGITNAETRVAGAYELPLADSSIDRAFLVTVLGEITDQRRALEELHRVLRPGGILSITEEFSDPDYSFAGETIRKAEAAGFRLSARFGNFLVYTLNFEKTEGVRVGTLDLLACPHCHAGLTLLKEESKTPKAAAGTYSLRCKKCRQIFPIRDGIVHFLGPKSLTGLNRRFAAMYDWMSWFYRPFSPIMFFFSSA
jgi:uncharacterized protein YbaR (Trm112 family)/protein-L-isoaspartate O-methyltransferase